MTLKSRRLEELAANKPYALVGGPFGSKLTSADYVEEGIPVIRGTNLTGGRYLTERDFVFVTDQKVRLDLFGNLAHPGDLVFTQRGTLGQVAMIPVDAPYKEYVVSQSQMKMSPDPTKVDTRYIYYWFTSRDTVQKLIGQNASSGVPHINLTVLRNFQIPIPDLHTQNAISNVLTAYDDLIENNKKRISLLEESARLLYREWFVHLRFPAHEHVKITDGVPAGWRRTPISDLSKVLRGRSYSSSELVDSEGQPFVNLKCIKRFGGFRLSGLKQFKGEHKPHHLLKHGDIVIAVTDMTREAMIVAQAARIPRAVGDGAIYSMDLVKVVPADSVESEWLYGMLRFSQFSSEVREKATGATVLHLLPKHIESWVALVPPTSLRAIYAEQVKAFLAQVDNLEIQNEGLERARDLLLPRLMSGELAA